MSIFRRDHMVHAMNDCAGCVLGGWGWNVWSGRGMGVVVLI